MRVARLLETIRSVRIFYGIYRTLQCRSLSHHHFSEVTGASQRLKPSITQQFVQQLVKTNGIKTAIYRKTVPSLTTIDAFKVSPSSFVSYNTDVCSTPACIWLLYTWLGNLSCRRRPSTWLIFCNGVEVWSSSRDNNICFICTLYNGSHMNVLI